MLYTLTTSSWTEPFSPLIQESAITALEDGHILHFPHLPFEFSAEESVLLTPKILNPGVKNVSFNPKDGRLKGVATSKTVSVSLVDALMRRFFNQSRLLIERLMPHYQTHLEVGRTSYRPIEVEGRKTSLLKDDTRLHVDAFSATPNHGKRILRVFSNVNPFNKPRVWHVGEPFEKVLSQFLPKLKKPIFGHRKLLSLLKITKSYRSLYDHYMLALHNAMKKDNDYQKRVSKKEIPFEAGTTWVVMTDAVSHAALSGQFLLEQTFYVEPKHMRHPEKSPLAFLQSNKKRAFLK